MRILIPTIGSRGDVQPYVNLAQGLLEAGHEVRIASNPTLRDLVETHGVPFAPVGRPVDMGVEGARLLEQSFGNMWLGLIRVMQLGARLVEEAFPEVLDACRGVDLVITSDSSAGAAEAQSLGVPWITVTLQPARLPTDRGQRGPVGRLSARVVGRALVAPTNRFRKRVGAPAVADMTAMMSARMVLLPVSRAVAQRNPAWAHQVRQTGYWFAREATGWQPPRDLAEFLSAGDKPIVVSLGVMGVSGKAARQSAAIVLEAVRRAGVRAVLQGWDPALLASLGASSHVYPAGSLPHGWLFGEAAAVVHHGGFGTTAAGLRSGVPSIVIPHIIDQFAWGQMVHELGAGPPPISRTKLSPRALAQAIEAALHDERVIAKAASVGQAIRDEPDGVSEAVKLIEGLGVEEGSRDEV